LEVGRLDQSNAKAFELIRLFSYAFGRIWCGTNHPTNQPIPHNNINKELQARVRYQARPLRMQRSVALAIERHQRSMPDRHCSSKYIHAFSKWHSGCKRLKNRHDGPFLRQASSTPGVVTNSTCGTNACATSWSRTECVLSMSL
jgi:hypothetical protein